MASEATTLSTNDDYALSFQLGNVGAEVGRMLNWKSKGNEAQVNRSLERALDLLDSMLAADISRNAQRELCRLREVICSHVFTSREWTTLSSDLNSYFLPFARRAREL
ncbi:hypothetical protein A2936_00115 [Candidatus Uhrbacteria bacterium RIFCSPLOWO2_01_FULL_47_25]|nr:MAG: hypothetical protein UX68_C0023G0005 [Parcubacteria group bacterium GW2011_GWA2_46_9]OGL81473.1 MAG: hypothetical protein A2936_00115 [Candidatus Uhrbacteria bacterium RIFCSPLOWO2_01_FULL_47_25]